MPTLQDPRLLDALKGAAAVLRDAEVPFVLGGGLAAWARGGPATEHDIDLIIREEDAERSLAALAGAGLRVERPPEGWLVKAWDGDILVDLIFHPTGLQVDEVFGRADVLNVNAVDMAVMSMVDVLITKLMALTEHHLDYGPLLEYARSLREQVDWPTLDKRVRSSPFARAFLFLAGELGIRPGGRPDGAERDGPRGPAAGTIDPYVKERIDQALATDPRVGELGLTVEVMDDEVWIRGTVSTPERQLALSSVAEEVVPGVTVRNLTTVPPLDEPVGSEQERLP